MSTEFNYEQSIKRLEEIVNTFESKKLSLDEMISLYEEGVSLADVCAKALNSAELKITKLSESGSENE